MVAKIQIVHISFQTAKEFFVVILLHIWEISCIYLMTLKSINFKKDPY
jgi:hypothetical protein